MAYFQMEPWGTSIEDQRAAIIAATIANANRGPKQRPFRPDDFMPKYRGPRPRKQTAAEIKNVLLFLTKSVGGTITTQGKT